MIFSAELKNIDNVPAFVKKIRQIDRFCFTTALSNAPSNSDLYDGRDAAAPDC
jgi:hypothetical protein